MQDFHRQKIYFPIKLAASPRFFFEFHPIHELAPVYVS
jgi:hypothetical protein